MRLLVRLPLIGWAAVVLTFAACGDDDDDRDRSATPTTSGSATGDAESPGSSPDDTGAPDATETPEPTTAAPTPIAPTLAAGVRKIGEGTINFVLAANGLFGIDGLALIQPGTETPPCAAVVFSFDWQITEPYPPGGNTVQCRITSQDITEDVAAGPDGAATVGCGQLTAVNPGSAQISVAVHYIQGSVV